jgi:hypothetical protein
MTFEGDPDLFWNLLVTYGKIQSEIEAGVVRHPETLCRLILQVGLSVASQHNSVHAQREGKT